MPEEVTDEVKNKLLKTDSDFTLHFSHGIKVTKGESQIRVNKIIGVNLTENLTEAMQSDKLTFINETIYSQSDFIANVNNICKGYLELTWGSVYSRYIVKTSNNFTFQHKPGAQSLLGVGKGEEKITWGGNSYVEALAKN